MSEFQLCFVIDTTASMTPFIQALKSSLVEIVALSKLTGIDSISFLTYSDYSEPIVTKWSGWQNDYNSLLNFIENINAYGGDDYPEAARTALYELSTCVDDRTGKTLVFWFTDAPPHISTKFSKEKYLNKEKEYLSGSYNWITLTKIIKDKSCIIYPVIYTNDTLTISYFTYLSTVTGGNTFQILGSSRIIKRLYSSYLEHIPPPPDVISKNVINILISITGEKVEFTNSLISWIYENVDIQENDCDDVVLLSSNEMKYKLKKIHPFSNVQKLLSNAIDVYMKDIESNIQSIYNVFTFMLNKSNNPILLTYNPIFGKYWRLICRQRNDIQRDKLVRDMSNLLSNLKNNDKERFEVFLSESYNQYDIIKNIISECEPNPYFICNTQLDFITNMKDCLELARSCDIGKLGNMLQYISLINNNEYLYSNKNNIRYIPFTMNPIDIFKCIPHLYVHGAMFSLRPSAILACIAIYTNNKYLNDIAKIFINEIRGKWIDMTLPENYTYSFIKLMLSIPNALTNEEQNLFQKLNIIGGLLYHKNDNIDITVGYDSYKTKRPDYKFKCMKCSQYRSFTLLDKNGLCGLCINNSDPVNDDGNVKDSMWYSCSECKCQYVVADYRKMCVKPKCHYCRNCSLLKGITCTVCYNMFTTEFIANTDFICPSCNDEPKYDIYETNIYQYIKENPIFTIGDITFEVTDTDKFFKSSSIFKARSYISFICERNIDDIIYKCNKKNIVYIEELHKTINKKVLSTKTEKHMCSLCFEEYLYKDVFTICGRKSKCNNLVCRQCAISWYSQSLPGTYVNISNIFCPFCKRVPTSKVLKKTNKVLCSLKLPKEIHNNMVYGWCNMCYTLKESHPIQCNVMNVNQVDTHFICSDCVINNDVNNSLYKPCPTCDVMTQKISGCNHITCSNCMSHWCFECRQCFDESDIYTHMSNEHGGYGFDYEYSSDYSDDDYH